MTNPEQEITSERRRIKVGDIFGSNECGDMQVIEYNGWTDVVVKFLNTGYVSSFNSYHVKKGGCSDKTRRSVCGVGFTGVGRHKTSIKKKVTPAYRTWHNMISRCYDHRRHELYPSYKDCTVADDWHNFQNFADFYYENFKEGLELDKDTLIEGNRLYSKETCVFITKHENLSHMAAKNHTFISPEGEKVEIYNLTEWCRKSGINRTCMAQVKSGKRPHYKGWKRYE